MGFLALSQRATFALKKAAISAILLFLGARSSPTFLLH